MSNPSISTVWELFQTDEPARLGPERRISAQGKAELCAAVSRALAGHGCSETRAQLILALLLLWHDHLEAAHSIAQGIASVDGSLVHAIMHRREPDYDNSLYWWRKVGRHSAFVEIGRQANARLLSAHEIALSKSFLANGLWRPGAFVEACQAVADRPEQDERVRLLQELQRIEFEVLLGQFLNA